MVLSQLIQAARKAKGMTMSELARRVGFHRSHFSLLERGLRRLDDEAIVQVALVLGLDPGEALLAGLRERLPENLRHHVPVASETPDPDRLRATARLFHARQFEFEIERSILGWKSDWDGNLLYQHRVEGCRPSFDEKPVFEISFRQWTIGAESGAEEPGARFEIVTAPPKLEYAQSSTRVGKNAIDRILSFPQSWRRTPHQKHDAFTFAFENYHPAALYLDTAQFLKEAEKAGSRGPIKGGVNTYVRHMIRRLEISFELPAGYEPELWGYCVWWGAGPLLTATRNLEGAASRSLRFSAEHNRARLIVDEPMPGFTFSITWTPLDRNRFLEARHGGAYG